MNSTIIVYHGTTVTRGRSIIAERSIHTTNDMNKRHRSTKEGFVYVTSCLENAMAFSTVPDMQDDTSQFVVFRFVMPTAMLMIDEDEINWSSALFPNNGEFYRISNDIDLEKEKVHVLIKKDDYKKRGRNSNTDYQSYVCSVAKGIQESEWKETWHD